MALYREGKAALAEDGTVTGTGTKWQSSLSLIRPGATIMFLSSPIQMAVVNKVVSDTEIKAITTNGAVVASTDYAILLSDSLTVDGLAQDVAETLRYYQSQETAIADAVDSFKDFDFELFKNLANQAKADSEAANVSAANAADSENSSKTSETNAKTSETNAKSSENAAKTSEIAAENARDAAVAAKQESENAAEESKNYVLQASEVGNMFSDEAAGLAATSNGQFFQTPQGSGSFVSFKLFKNNNGIAEEVARVPGSAAITGTIRVFPTLASAQADADAGNILSGATAFYSSPDDSALSIEVMNVGGTLQPTGRTMDAGGNIQQAPLSESLTIFTDDLGFSHSRICSDGSLETPMSLLGENEISSGNLSVIHDPYFDDAQLILSDGLGFSIPVRGGDEGGSVDPGEVTVDLPPQTAAYGLLSKMRAALDDVCIIINSDSTGITQDTDPSTGQVFKKWTRKLAEFLAGNYPAYTVNYYSWSSNAYTTPETIQVGTAGKTLHFYNAAVAGTQPLYLMGQYFETAYVPRQADLIIFNHGHNTDNNVPASTHMGMDLAIVYTMLQRHPNAGAIVVSQNPLRDNDNGTVRSNGARQAAITAGFSLVDAFQLFQNAGKPSSWYMDNIHPNATGDAKIFDLVKNMFVWPASPSRFIPGLAAGTNLLTNADFSAWSDGLDAPDGWSLTGCTAEKDTTNFESGDYGLRLNQTGTIETYAAKALPAALVKRLRGKTVVLAARVFVPSTSTRGNCGSIQIPEIPNNRPYGTPIGGRGGFIWKATVITIPTTATALTVRAVLDTSGGAAGNWCTFDRLTLIAGTIPQDFY